MRRKVAQAQAVPNEASELRIVVVGEGTSATPARRATMVMRPCGKAYGPDEGYPAQDQAMMVPESVKSQCKRKKREPNPTTAPDLATIDGSTSADGADDGDDSAAPDAAAGCGTTVALLLATVSTYVNAASVSPTPFHPPVSYLGSGDERMKGHSGLRLKLANLTTSETTRPRRKTLRGTRSSRGGAR